MKGKFGSSEAAPNRHLMLSLTVHLPFPVRTLQLTACHEFGLLIAGVHADGVGVRCRGGRQGLVSPGSAV